jgi:hypothetical protein
MTEAFGIYLVLKCTMHLHLLVDSWEELSTPCTIACASQSDETKCSSSLVRVHIIFIMCASKQCGDSVFHYGSCFSYTITLYLLEILKNTRRTEQEAQLIQ